MANVEAIAKDGQPTASDGRKAGIWSCDGQEFKRLIHGAMAWFERHIQAVNALNVFPVPDGDTGTNMYLTLQAAWQDVSNLSENSVSAVAQAVARGALMGARGNSGVILSQLFRGLAQGLEHAIVMDPALFARALQQASATAYKAVIRPVEGTILTVARQAARAGAAAAEGQVDFLNILSVVVEAAAKAVAETPSQLPVLAEAGVVDAGGQGLYHIFEGMLRCARGDTTAGTGDTESMEMAHAEGMAAEYGYDVQYILQGEMLDVERIRADISAMGESVLVVGDSTTIKVHIHTPEPGTPLNYGAMHGALSRIIVENMQEQYQEFLKKRQAQLALPPQPPRPKPAPAGIAVIAVVNGEGLRQVFESLGVAAIVPGGQTMNPSTEDWIKAIEQVGSDEVVLLPNNSNVILTAQQAQKLSSRQVRVVPTRSIPQGIGALLAFNYQADLDANVRGMEEAAQAVQTGEVTRAVRSATYNGIKVEQGQCIGLLNDKLAAAGNSEAEVVQQLLREMGAENLEIITLYYGEGLTQQEAESLAAILAAQYPEQEIEVHYGGQPHYSYLISGE